MWGVAGIPLWTPASGAGLALVAWHGSRAVAPLFLASLILLAWRGLADPADLAWAVPEAVLAFGEPFLAWQLYHHLGRGSRRLVDPRSSILFVFLVPGAAAIVSALVRLPVALALLPLEDPAWRVGARLWLDHALGLAVIAPPLLVCLAPATSGQIESRRSPRRGDWIEIIGLAVGSALLCLLISAMHTRRELLGWQLWGAQILLIVWASFRQGLQGGTLVAAASAALPLLILPLWSTSATDPLLPLLQSHLLTQACAALLVSAASSWARADEVGYRQAAAYIPVVIYSVRLGEVSVARGGGEIVLVSDACGGVMGCTPDDLMGDYRHWLDRIHPEDRELILAAIGQLARQQTPVVCEYRLAGGERWMRDTLAPRRDPDGRLVGWEGAATDITQQRHLADDLRRTTGMFNALVANLPAGVYFVQGLLGQPVLVNARARQLLGQREDAAPGIDHLPRHYRLHKPNGSLYPAEELPVSLALREGRTTMRDDIIVHRADGRRVPLIAWAAPVQAGKVPSAVWVMEDLTALHQAEAARKESEGRLRAIIETMAEAMLVHDANETIVHSNPAASVFFGMTAEQLRERSADRLGWQFVREDGSPLPAEEFPFRQVLRAGRPVRNLVLGAYPAATAPPVGREASSSIRWLLVNAMPLPGSPPTGVVTTMSDISAAVHARDVIRDSEERYRGLVESLPLMMVMSDLDNRVIYVNPATSAISGYSLEEVADPVAWATLVHPEDLEPIQALFREAKAGKAGRLEYRYRARDGTEKAALTFMQPRWEDGKIVGTMSLILDRTRERQLARDLQRGQQLELIGRLASGVAHDFNNMLAVVLGLADLARFHLPVDHPVHADLARITQAGEQATELAAQMLAFSRSRPRPARLLRLEDVARRTLDLVRASLPASVRLDASLAEPGQTIQADETQVQQVLMNLCLNARDAMPGGGVLRVRTWRDGAWAAIEVRDSGKGMPEEVSRRIFEPFYSTKEGGTGLGLAVVQQIVEGFQGTIEVRSEVGLGTQFIIRWPATHKN